MTKTRKNSKEKAKKKEDAGPSDQQTSIANVNNSHANMHNKSKRVLETQILEELPAKKVAKGTVQVKSNPFKQSSIANYAINSTFKRKCKIFNAIHC